MDIFSSISLHDIYLIVFSLGLAIASGSALVSNILFLTATNNRKVSTDELAMIRSTESVQLFGLALYGMAGIGLFTLSYEVMLTLGIFQAAMVVTTGLLVNIFIYRYKLYPVLRKQVQTKGALSNSLVTQLVISGAVTMVSWMFLIIHHALYRAPFNVWLILAVYFFVLGVFIFIYLYIANQRIKIVHVKTLLGLFLFIGLLIVGLVGLGLIVANRPLFNYQQNAPSFDDKSDKKKTFTLAEVAKHNQVNNCWVVIKDAIYDATPVAEKYPDVYKCGADSTTSYLAISSEGVSERVQGYQIGWLGFTINEVIKHNQKNDCWLIIDDMVFDATSQSKLHPATFHCGTDASINYHRNHGQGISNKMMVMQIGYVDDGEETNQELAVDQTNKREIKPYPELYVPSGSWDNRSLMVVVEKDVEKLLFIDGQTHNPVGHINDVGFQPHTSVFSPDAKFMYIIARNGWLLKIDLTSLETLSILDVGENSRGTALTDDGSILAIGNYEPGNVVIIDPKTFTILKKIPTTGEIKGESITSRVGAVVQKGTDIIVALKDLNSVWIIDTTKSDFPIKEKYGNIGDNNSPLHDAYLTPDGRFYIVASMGSNTVWVLDTETWQPVGEVKTGDTPHTGPGATWKNTTYVPALGEGLITAINTTTWQPEAYIKTAGPGLFVRSYAKNNFSYPYIWADTAFGEFHDEIYVIDARTNSIAKTLRPVPGESSWHPEFTLDGKFVYVVSQTGNQIVIYDAFDFSVIKTITAETPSAVSNVGLRIEELGL